MYVYQYMHRHREHCILIKTQQAQINSLKTLLNVTNEINMYHVCLLIYARTQRILYSNKNTKSSNKFWCEHSLKTLLNVNYVPYNELMTNGHILAWITMNDSWQLLHNWCTMNKLALANNNECRRIFKMLHLDLILLGCTDKLRVISQV